MMMSFSTDCELVWAERLPTAQGTGSADRMEPADIAAGCMMMTDIAAVHMPVGNMPKVVAHTEPADTGADTDPGWRSKLAAQRASA